MTAGGEVSDSEKKRPKGEFGYTLFSFSPTPVRLSFLPSLYGCAD